MRQLYYTIKTLIRGKSSNVVKIISLTLGLFVGILLFARIAYEYSWNTVYEDPSRLAVIKVKYFGSGVESMKESRIVFGPTAAAIMEAFPDEVESATTTCLLWNQVFSLGTKEFQPLTEVVDTLFFRTMGIPITSGRPEELAAPDMMFLSDDMARQIFGTTDVIGRTLMYRGVEFSVRGTYKSIGNNNYMRPEAVVSMASLHKYKWRYYGWDGGDSYEGYIRLKNKDSVERINARIDAVIEEYVPFNLEEYGFGIRAYIQNILDVHRDNPDVKRIVVNYTFLAIAILLIAALNYVLIAISSLARRAKGVGVHKANGATGSQVFSMFLWETGILILFSLLLVALLILNLREPIEDWIDVQVVHLFAWQTLWVPASIVLLVLLLAGVIPGRMFSNIPVTQVFRRYINRNSSWKRVLLFVQFGGVAFVFGVLVVLFLQYKQLLNYDLGYSVKNVATATIRGNRDVVRSMVENLPMVEKLSFSMQGVGIGYSGAGVTNGGRMLFSTRFNSVDENFVGLYGIRILEGRNIQAPGEVLVNKIYVGMMPWEGSALGRVSSEHDVAGTVVGVIEDIVDNGLFTEKKPLLLTNLPDWNNLLNVKLREPFEQSLFALNKAMAEAFPQTNIVFDPEEPRIVEKYNSTRRFRDSAGAAFIAILLITLMGLIGYINDEVQRRSKEIAIRKVNGAEAWSILLLLNKEILWLAVPAVILGTSCSYFVGKEWLAQFSGDLLELSVPLYILISLIILVVIIICVIVKAWKIANENPVNSIKSE